LTSPSDAQQPGESFVQELRWVHGMIRRDLNAVQRLAAETLEGVPPDDLRAEIASLQTGGPLWKLRMNCLHYCSFVHGHHSLEHLDYEEEAISPTLMSWTR
jgi:hypothetical protein